MKNKIIALGEQVANLEKFIPDLCKKIIQENTGRFFVHKEDLMRIYLKIVELSTRHSIEAEIISAGEFDEYKFDSETAKFLFFEGYHKAL